MPPTLRIGATLVTCMFAVLLSGCGAFPTRDRGPSTSMDVANTPDPVPKWEPRSAYGNKPYQVSGISYPVMEDASGYVERGLASWYGLKFHGQYTSSREVYNMYGMSAAHRNLPLPTYVRVTNIANGRSCIVRVNDRGPFHSERLIDLSYAAASKLGIVETGTAMVEVRAIDAPEAPDAPRVSEAVVTAQPGFRAEAAPVLQPLPVVLPAATSESAPAADATAAGARLYVQVGAFANRDNAERLRARLDAEEKLPALIKESVAANRNPLYLVRVGPFASGAEAERIITRVQSLGVGAPRLIREQP